MGNGVGTNLTRYEQICKYPYFFVSQPTTLDHVKCMKLTWEIIARDNCPNFLLMREDDRNCPFESSLAWFNEMVLLITKQLVSVPGHATLQFFASMILRGFHVETIKTEPETEAAFLDSQNMFRVVDTLISFGWTPMHMGFIFEAMLRALKLCLFEVYDDAVHEAFIRGLSAVAGVMVPYFSKIYKPAVLPENHFEVLARDDRQPVRAFSFSEYLVNSSYTDWSESGKDLPLSDSATPVTATAQYRSAISYAMSLLRPLQIPSEEYIDDLPPPRRSVGAMMRSLGTSLNETGRLLGGWRVPGEIEIIGLPQSESVGGGVGGGRGGWRSSLHGLLLASKVSHTAREDPDEDEDRALDEEGGIEQLAPHLEDLTLFPSIKSVVSFIVGSDHSSQRRIDPTLGVSEDGMASNIDEQ